MHPTTHLLGGWLVANTLPLTRRERAFVTGASIVPDIDGVGVVAELATRNTETPLLWWSQYHHTLAHNITFGVGYAVLAALLVKNRWRTGGLALLGFHLHLLGDIVGARGPDQHQWPIPYWLPFSDSWQLTWEHQWALNAWPNAVITAVALSATLYLAWKRGYSPLEMLSNKADEVFIHTLRNRFPHTEPGGDEP